MRIVSIGGGPAALYAAILIKKADPTHEVTIHERNRPDDTFGFGVVFSDATMGAFAAADRESHAAISARFAHWDDVDIHYGGQVITSRGHGFAGMSRRGLLEVLRDRAAGLGVDVRFSAEVGPAELDRLHAETDLLIGADGVNSMVRQRLAQSLGPRIDTRPNRFVWLGTTFPFRAFTFYFKQAPEGLFRVHAYRYATDQATFIVECTAETFARTGLTETDEDATVQFCERVFADELQGHRLLKNRSHWRQFPTVRLDHWWHENVVLLGDAAHTAHFSIGSGTKLAMEGAIALGEALGRHRELPAALGAYEAAHRPVAERLQRAAQVSLRWFEETERYASRLPPLQFAFSLLTRSLRIGHEGLKARDPQLIAQLDEWFAAEARRQAGDAPGGEDRPTARGTGEHGRPLAAPFLLRGLRLPNRLVADRVDGHAGLVLRPAGGDSESRALAARAANEARARGVKAGVTLSARGATALGDALEWAYEVGFDLVELADGDPALISLARGAWPKERPLGARLPPTDDAAAAARALKAAGCDLVRVGATTDGRLVHAPEAERVRLEADVATLLDDGFASLDDVDSVVAAGRADLCLVKAW
jgi:anthraniloyl-CoA monooxygenase